MFRVLSVVLVAFVLCGATSPPAKLETARTAFRALPLQERLDIQSLLTVNGYWSAVASDTFGPKLMAAIQEFQTASGFEPTGILTAEQREALRAKASPLLRLWDLSPVRHPSASATLWVPSGIGLKPTADKNGIIYKGIADDFSIAFLRFRSVDLEFAYRLLRREMLVSDGMSIDYEVIKDDFFVLAASKGNLSAYMRYHATGSGIVGFSMFWEDGTPLRGERLVVLISDLFRASVSLRQPRQPPRPVEASQSNDRRFIIISSRTEPDEAIAVAKEHHLRLSRLSAAVGVGPNFDDIFVARFANGRYAVVLGPIEASKAPEIRDGFRDKGIIPADSFVSDGTKLLEVLWTAPEHGGRISTTAPPSAPLHPSDVESSSGTGFYVAPETVLTNAHVVEGCTTVTTSLNRNPVAGKVLARDEANDLALIRAGEGSATVALLRSGVKLGEDVAAFGFPLSDKLASTGNFTRGNVTATAGLHDDSRHIQFSAPIQPGNSGGPLLDETGNVVGVIFSKLKDTRTADGSGNINQNVNFAIKTAMAQSFLESNGVTPQAGSVGEVLRPADLAAKAQKFTVAIRCRP
ncbi:serine protease [Ancylobacter defluvii]|uniref:Peptidoglycan binding-like domain-containing protein n=1 Tax=Ancylobacter defluvii TaxID=1282440 RepID=A0A9W6JZQ0_9HYPH|nr:serine protease [Ancylobacter defluvii]MBS7587061.1 trypsin-like peptidase domain-containing protein [Ancylobacter defluvii]GLK85473.1 hypothetical protein GCM10017653_35430 [Ancylobacter defluvii]